MLKVVNNSRAKKVMKYFTYQKVNHSLCIEVEVKKCETKINQNVQKKTNLKTSLNNLEKIE